MESAILAFQSINGRYFAGKQVKCEFVNISRWKVAICGEYMKSRLKACSRGSACNFIHCFRNPGGDYEWADHDKPPPRFWMHKMTALFGYANEYLKHTEREYSRSLNDLPTDSHRQLSRRSKSRDHDHANVGSKPSYGIRKTRDDTQDSTREHKLSRYADERPSSTRDGSLERKEYKEPLYAKDTLHRDSRWSECSPRHRMIKKRIHGRYSDDDSSDGDDYGRRGTSQKRKVRRGTDSEVQEQMDNKKDLRTLRSSRKYNKEGSSAYREEDHEQDRIRTICDKSQRESSNHRRERSSSRYSHEKDLTESKHHPHKRSDLQDDGENDKRSQETSPREYQSDNDRDRSKQSHRYKTRDSDYDRTRKRKPNGRSSRNGASSSSSEEGSGREETHKERSHRHKKRRRSQHPHDQTPKFYEESEKVEEEVERWRPT